MEEYQGMEYILWWLGGLGLNLEVLQYFTRISNSLAPGAEAVVLHDLKEQGDNASFTVPTATLALPTPPTSPTSMRTLKAPSSERRSSPSLPCRHGTTCSPPRCSLPATPAWLGGRARSAHVVDCHPQALEYYSTGAPHYEKKYHNHKMYQ